MIEKNPHIIDQLLISYILEEADDATKEIVERWINENSENSEYFNQLKKTWTNSKDLSPKPVAVDIDKAWQNINTKIISKKINYQFLLRIAAILLLTFGIYFTYNLLNSQNKNSIIVATDNILNDTLKDGSIINLNKNSKLLVSKKFDKKSRNVKLEGEAFFEIAHNKQKPFIIETDAGYIQVVGTKFNVNTTDSNFVDIYVEEGIVKLFTVSKKSNDTLSVLLTKGEKGQINKKTKIPIKLIDKTENVNDLYWKTNNLEFNSSSLQNVAKTLENYYKVHINLSPEIKDLKLTTSFENEDIETVLSIIKLTFNLEITQSGNNFYIHEAEN